ISSFPFPQYLKKKAIPEAVTLQCDRLLEVDGISLCGITHKQAVEHLKKSGQIARLVLERGNYQLAEPCLTANDRKEDQCTVVSVATSLTDGTKDCCFLTDDNTFEVKLTKNSGGLGFSVLQMEGDACEHLGGAIVRIKRLFPGQPAEENGEIEVGDVILAVNGKPLKGLLYQDVLHLLRGAPREVTLLLCRPPKGVLPEIEPIALVRQNLEDCLDSPVGEDFSEPPEDDSSAYEEQEAEFQEKPIQKLPTSRESFYKHLWKIHQEASGSEIFHSLEEEVKQNCYSPCEFGQAKR
uniref:FERM and PDZ domain containing 2 n=1 Tax=Junco hyemalis TaxID=40217 RepID=A0A8C5NTK4_JUNHY